MVKIPESHRDLLEEPILVSMATVQPDGQPQVTPVWADLEDGCIRINTVEGRRKYKNIVERPLVTLLAVDPENPYRYIEVRGKVTRIQREGADAHIDKLAREYTGADEYPNKNPNETRVIAYVEPIRVQVAG